MQGWKRIAKFFVVALGVLAAAPADAKRGGRGAIIPIPGFGGSESIELVRDLDDVPALHYRDDVYIDLGYLHSGSDSRWVGHIGSSKTFLDPGQEHMELIIRMGGLQAFPPVPEKEFPLKGMLLIGGIILLFNFRKIMRAVRGNAAGSMKKSAQRAVARADRSGVNWDHMDAKIAAAASQSAQERPDPAPRPRPRPRRTAPAGGGFGKRGL